MSRKPKYLRKRLSGKVTAQQRYALVILMEEAGEVIQAASKALRWGFDSRNPDDASHPGNMDQLMNEVADVQEAMDRVKEACR